MSEEYHQNKTDVKAILIDASNIFNFTKHVNYAFLNFCKKNGTENFQHNSLYNIKADGEQLVYF